MSWRKIDKNKYIVEVEKTVKGKRRRKKERVETDLKGKNLEFFMLKKEQDLYSILESNTKYRYTDYLFEDFSELFLEKCLARQRTVDSYRQLLNLRTIDFFRGMKITEIEEHDIKRFIKFLKEEISPRTGKRLSNKTIGHYRNTLRVMFNYAKKTLKIIKENPVDDVQIPAQSGELKHGYYDENSVQKIIKCMESHAYLKYFVFFLIQTFLGSRPGEIYGLKWKKINLGTGRTIINESLVRNSNGYFLETTKTEDHFEETLPPYIMWKLEELKEIEKEKHKCDDIEDKFIFTNDDGEHLAESAFRSYFRNFCRRHDLKYIPPYGLRHTTATILASMNVPEVNIATRLRHKNRSTTTKYIHATEGVKDQIRDILTKTTTPKLGIVKKVN